MKLTPLLCALFFVLSACDDDPQTTADAVADSAIQDTSTTPDTSVDTLEDTTPPGDTASPDTGSPDTASPDTSPDTVEPPPFTWPVPTEDITITPSDTWKNTITFRDEPFLSPQRRFDGGPEVQWVKFAVLMRDPSKVYFQDSVAFPFHYDFATAHLDPFQGMTRAEFDAISLHETGQEVILGAVLYAPREDTAELGIQLVRQDAYHREMVKIVFDLVRDSITLDKDNQAGVDPFYFPTFEQLDAARADTPWFTDNDIAVSSVHRWAEGDVCYTPGWALGRLTFVPATEIQAAYIDGRLKPTDILLTDGVPAEVPSVAGILTTAPSTPNSHVAILSANFGIPFVFLADTDRVSEALGLVGKDVALRADAGFSTCSVSLLDVTTSLSAGDKAAILDLKAPAELNLTPKATLGQIAVSTEGLTEADIATVGGKAAHFGLLRSAIPDNSPVSIALSMDLWDAFMDQTLTGGGTLAEAIDARLSAYTTYPPADMSALSADLAAIRLMITDQTSFTSQQMTAIEAALSPFDPNRKIRFRSSTNVEDSESFTGAGLYDSYSGCLADDNDGDAVGPSLCDTSKSSERGVYRAIRKVYASFYNDNAFLERLRHGVDETEVGMAVLVHHSFPDEIELANGVATLRYRATSQTLTMVTQKGAVSVTNPEGSATPEEMTVSVFSFGTFPEIVTHSSLVPLGGTVLDFEDDYIALAGLLGQVADAYATAHPEKTAFWLDFEYKKVAPDGKLVVKQVRPLPIPSNEATVPTFLVPEPVELCVFQGEYNNVFGNHRLKSRWSVTPRATWLNDAGLATTFMTDVSMETASGTQSGSMADWSDATHAFKDSQVDEGFVMGDATYRLEMQVQRMVRPTESPLRTLRDFQLYLHAEHTTAQPVYDWTGASTTTTDVVRLVACPTEAQKASMRERTLTGPGGLQVETSYWWPPAPGGIVAGYTAPLVAWESTTITGLASTPITLTGWFSQTYRPEHHNFGANFIFEPGLEPGIDASVITELEGADIRYLFINDSGAAYVVGLDGKMRAL